MQFVNQGLSLWYATPDAPAPEGAMPAGVEQLVTIGLSPPDGSNRVQVHYRINAGPVNTIPTRWFRNDHARDAQYFTARLPAFEAGDNVEFWATAACAGRYVPAPDAAGTAVTRLRIGKSAIDESDRQEPDYRVWLAAQSFDPKDVESHTQRQAAAAKERPASVAAGGRTAAAQGAPGATVVQFTDWLSGPDRARLRTEYAVKLDRYIPNLAYLERLPAETVDRLRGDFLVRACLALDPAVKLAPWIAAPDVPRAQGAPLELIATLFDAAETSPVESALRTMGAADVQIYDDRAIGGRMSARFVLDDPARLPQIAGIHDIVLIEPVPVIVNHTNVEASQTIQSGHLGTGGNPIWDHRLHGEGQVIGVIEPGTPDIKHCFFTDPDHEKAGPDHRKMLKIINQVERLPENHTTFVAGIVAGDEVGNPGGHKNRGGAWAAKLVCGNLYDSDHFHGGWDTFFSLLDKVREAGAFIHNHSWGDELTKYYNNTAFDVDSFSWTNEYHTVIAAGQNSNATPFNTPPGVAKNVLCVTATKAFPDEMERGSGVAGPTTPDKRRKPDLMAVGCGIQSALIAKKDTCFTGYGADIFKYVCATSWAAAQASAAAALVRQYFIEGWHINGKKEQKEWGFTPSGALIRAVLLNSTVDMTRHNGYPSDVEGWGLIRLNRALYFAGGPRQLMVRDVKRGSGLEQHDSAFYWLFVMNRTEQLKITLVWTDPPSLAFVSPSVNVISLTAKDPAGTKYVGNDFDLTSGVSTPNGAGPQDLVNNVQMVIVNNPAIGIWAITLHADRVLGDAQGYALAVSGGLK